MVDHTYIEKIFGKKYEDLYPSVQKLLTETAEGHPVYEGIMNELCRHYTWESYQGAKHVDLPHRDMPGKTQIKRIDFKKLAPEPEDITKFFAHIAKGMQHVGEHYGENPHIDHLLVFDHKDMVRFRLGNIAFCKEFNDLSNVLIVDLQEIFHAKGHRLEQTERPLGESKKRYNLGFSVKMTGEY